MSIVGMRFPSANPAEATGHARPSLPRRDTDNILSYYQSEDAGKTYYANGYDHRVTLASTATSSRSSSPSSTYSDGELNPPSVDVSAQRSPLSPVSVQSPSIAQRRTSKGSTGGSDKRRVAIVEMDSVPTATSSCEGVNSLNYYQHGSEQDHRDGTSDLLSRRGRGNLAFVAPPDAAPSLYAELTPPRSAPVVPEQFSREESTQSTSSRHSRSHSDAVGPRRARMRKTSRDIGIVGTSISLSPTQVKMELGIEPVQTQPPIAPHSQHLSPVFQTPHLSPGTSQVIDPLLQQAESFIQEARAMRDKQKPLNSNSTTNKRDSAISPVIVGITSEQMWQAPPVSAPVAYSMLPSQPINAVVTSNQHVSTPAYLFYQPGVHASAGPLPPPPRNLEASSDTVPPPRRLSPSSSGSPPPPRPPRLLTPASSDRQKSRHSPKLNGTSIEKSASHVPPQQEDSDRRSGSPKVESCPVETSQAQHEPQHSDSQISLHTREGAFPDSPTTADNPLEAVLPEMHEPQDEHSDIPVEVSDTHGSDLGVIAEVNTGMSTISEPLSTPPERDLTGQRSAIDLRHEVSRATMKDSLMIGRSSSASPIKTSKALPDHPPSSFPSSTSDHGHTSASAFESKRFSQLPRTPSKLSFSHASKSSDNSGDRHSPRAKAVILTKIKSPDPNAMYFGDIIAMRGPSQRAVGYANKINELAGYDAGLEDWVKSMKRQKSKAWSPLKTGGSITPPMSPRGPSDYPFVVQKRHASRGSIASEATFPRRPDANVATDLTPSEDETVPEGPPPSLPYPGLVQGVRVPPSRTFGGPPPSAPSIHSIPSITPSTAKSPGGGFFATISRKASMKREKSNASSQLSNRLLMKRNPTLPPAPRPVQINVTPSLPGGPRAPPNRLQRTQSVIAPAKTTAASLAPSLRVERHMSHRSSSSRTASISPTMISSPLSDGTPDFEKQVKKLVDLLPNTDPRILSGYLRRAGQDMLAIGQYLEDEKRGCIRRD